MRLMISFVLVLMAGAASAGAVDTIAAGSTTAPASATATQTAIDSLHPAPTDGTGNEQPMYACACGCDVFEVATPSMLPLGNSGLVYLEFDYQNQNIDWNGHSRAPAAGNPDKKIETSFYTLGLQYMFNRNWGIQAELPIDNREFITTGGATGSQIVGSRWTDLGDIRVWGIYTGLMEDQSLGLTFGLKLPTGNYTHNNAYGDVDRDSEIGTGSTDLLLGGFYRHHLWAKYDLDWYAQVNFDIPFLFRGDDRGSYRPGAEVDGAAGIYYTALKFSPVRITPVAQIIAAVRRQDSGSAAADPIASGFQRVSLSPGFEVDLHPFMFYADVELPVYQNSSGYQLMPSYQVKAEISYRF